MTREQILKKFDILDFFYEHKKENFTHNGFNFKKGEYYEMIQDEDGVTLFDDYDEWHELTYEEAKRLL